MHIDYVTDYSTRYPHQRRTTGYENDDENLRSNPYTEIYFTANGERHVVDSAKHRSDDAPRPYEKIEEGPVQRLNIARSDDQYDYYNTSRETKYRRADGTIFTKRTPDIERVLKQKLPASVQGRPNQVHNQQTQSGGHRDIFKNIVTFGNPGSDCEIM